MGLVEEVIDVTKRLKAVNYYEDLIIFKAVNHCMWSEAEVFKAVKRFFRLSGGCRWTRE